MNVIKLKKNKFGWSMRISTKLKDDSWINTYMNVSIKLPDNFDTELNTLELIPVEWFLSPYKTRSGDVRIKLVILQYSLI